MTREDHFGDREEEKAYQYPEKRTEAEAGTSCIFRGPEYVILSLLPARKGNLSRN